MATLTPTTELGAVNIMLGVISQSPVSTLLNTTSVAVVRAKAVLEEIAVEVQTVGWDFNSEENYPLAPNLDGELIPPSNTARIDACDETLNIVQRGTRLYDKTNHTYNFDGALKFDVVVLLNFEELPQAARRYIAIRASRVFGDRMVGADAVHAYTKQDEVDARIALEAAEGETGDYNILDNEMMALIVNR